MSLEFGTYGGSAASNTRRVGGGTGRRTPPHKPPSQKLRTLTEKSERWPRAGFGRRALWPEGVVPSARVSAGGASTLDRRGPIRVDLGLRRGRAPTGWSEVRLLPERTSDGLEIFCRALRPATERQRSGVVWDGSGSHRSEQFPWPRDLVPLRLPAYSPE